MSLCQMVAVYSAIICAAPNFIVVGLLADEPADSPKEFQTFLSRYFELREKEDLNAVMAMWHSKAPQRDAHHKQLEKAFGSSDNRFSKLAISQIKRQGDTVTMRVEIEQVLSRKNSKRSETRTVANIFQLVQEGDQWRIQSQSPLGRRLWTQVRNDAFRGQELMQQEKFEEALAVTAKANKQAEKYGFRDLAAAATGNLAAISFRQQKFDDALQFLSLATRRYIELNDAISVLRQLTLRAEVYKQMHNHKQVIQTYLQALQVAQQTKNTPYLAGLHGDCGSFYNQLGRFDNADKHLSVSLALYEQMNDPFGIARQHNNLGNNDASRGEHDSAIAHYLKARELFQRQGNEMGIAHTYQGVGYVHQNRGDYLESRTAHQEALGRHERLQDRTAIAGTLASLARVEADLGDHKQSLKLFNRSLKIHQSLKNRWGVAKQQAGIAYVYHQRGDYRRAMQLYQTALREFEQLQSLADAAITLSAIGHLYQEQGALSSALDMHDKALSYCTKAGDKGGIASALGNIGIVHRKARNKEEAIDYFTRSIETYRQLNDSGGIARQLANLGTVYAQHGEYNKAIRKFADAEQKLAKGKNKEWMVASHLNFAETLLMQEQYREALSRATQGIAAARDIGKLDSLWQLQLIAGQACDAIKQTDQARDWFRDAIDSVEKLQSQVAGSEQSQQLFFQNKTEPYKALIDALVDNGDIDEAWTTAERAKSRVLADVLHRGRRPLGENLTDDEKLKTQRLRQTLISLNAQIVRQLQRENLEDDKHLRLLMEQRAKSRRVYEQWQVQLHASHPDLAVRNGEIGELPLATLAGDLVKTEATALLQFVSLNTSTLLFVVTRADTVRPPSTRVYRIDASKSQLEKWVSDLRKHIYANDARFHELSTRVYRTLFGKAAKQLAGKSAWVISPDGPLWELPFAALQVDDGRFVVQDAAISLAPSFGTLHKMQSAGNNSESLTGRRLLAMGNPAIGQKRLTSHPDLQGNDRTSRGQLADLPNAAEEVRALQQQYLKAGSNRTDVYTAGAASEQQFKSMAQSADVIHLAAHGILDNNNPLYSHIMLSAQGDGSPEDGLLEAWEIMDLKLRAKLTVLSACESAGAVCAGEGMIGLSWALFVAGCPTTLTSLWKVDDHATKTLMIEFHRQLTTATKNGATHSTAQALRRAQTTMIERYDPRKHRLQRGLKLTGGKLNGSKLNGDQRPGLHPFYWAGFVLSGDGR